MNNGVWRKIHYGLLRISEAWNEWRFSISTSEDVSLDTYGINNHDCVGYEPVTYSSFRSVMKHIEIEREKDVFIDYGAGKGRVVVLAATYAFRRVIGVELVPELAVIARESVDRAIGSFRCQQIEIVIADASKYALPNDVTIIHFCNPFRGEILSRVAYNIKASLLKSPRRLTILFGNPDDFERVLGEGNSIPSDWIMIRQDVLWPHFDHSKPNANRYRIYRIYPQ